MRLRHGDRLRGNLWESHRTATHFDLDDEPVLAAESGVAAAICSHQVVMQRGGALTADMLDEFHGFVQEELAALLEEKNAEIAYLRAIANGKIADAAQMRLHHAGLEEDKTSSPHASLRSSKPSAPPTTSRSKSTMRSHHGRRAHGTASRRDPEECQGPADGVRVDVWRPPPPEYDSHHRTAEIAGRTPHGCRVAARGARAAGRDASDWVFISPIGRSVRAPSARIPPGPQGDELRRGREHRDRRPLGVWPITTASATC